MSKFPTYYQILGVSPDAPQSKIHDAYVAALQTFRANFETDPAAQEKLDSARLAYKVIGTHDGRVAYNASLHLKAPPERKYGPYL